jgi:hypothetical protein
MPDLGCCATKNEGIGPCLRGFEPPLTQEWCGWHPFIFGATVPNLRSVTTLCFPSAYGMQNTVALSGAIAYSIYVSKHCSVGSVTEIVSSVEVRHLKSSAVYSGVSGVI